MKGDAEKTSIEKDTEKHSWTKGGWEWGEGCGWVGGEEDYRILCVSGFIGHVIYY